MKKVVIVHGWEGYPEEGWFPWLKKELEKKSFKVIIPQLPETNKPRIYNWVPALSQAIGEPDEETFLIGHSMGCQAVARYLETLPVGTRIGGVIFVAGFFKRLTGLEDNPDVQETDRHWLAEPIDFNKIKPHLPKSVALFSKDDPWVPLDNQDDFKNKLGSDVIIVNKMRHFSGDDGITKLPIVLTQLLKISA